MKKRIMKNAMSLPRQLFAAARGGGDRRKTAGKLERRVLVRYEALPDYLQDNEYITNYYRCEWPLKDIVLSIFSLHNETVNIWTHLLGFMLFGWMMIRSLTEKVSVENVVTLLLGKTSDQRLTPKLMNHTNGSDTGTYMGTITKSAILNAGKDFNSLPIWPWLVFLCGAMSCLIFSSVSHIFASHSRRFYHFFWRLDYAGISIMIVCSFFAPIYYIFSDHPNWRFVYLSSITIMGVLVILMLHATSLSSTRFRFLRATVFLCMGFSGVIPATHAVILYWDQRQIFMSLVYEILMGLLYGVGAYFYVSRIPEKWKPGAFDIIGQSHQIFHIFVVAAALSHCAATLIIMEWRRSFTSLTNDNLLKVST